MENDVDIVLTNFETGDMSLMKNSDLNNLFNFTYNFDFLKEILITVIKNQISLKNQFDEKCKAQIDTIESFKKDIIQNNQTGKTGQTDQKTKEILFNNNIKENLDKINDKVNKLEIKIERINAELDKSKLII